MMLQSLHRSAGGEDRWLIRWRLLKLWVKAQKGKVTVDDLKLEMARLERVPYQPRQKP